MNLFLSEYPDGAAAADAVALDDLLLTDDLPTTAGSLMLDGYRSLFESEAATRLKAAGFALAGKVNVGEFGCDLLGETSYFGACTDEDGNLTSAASVLLAQGDVMAVVGLDVNGAQRRAAALSGQVCLKPTYGTVSRYGTIAVACSGETVCVSARNVEDCRRVISALAGHDDKDGTSLPEDQCARIRSDAERRPVRKVALAASLIAGADAETQAAVNAMAEKFTAAGIVVEEVDDTLIAAARPAWNIALCAELCNNVSRFDGVRYGHRATEYETIGELYTNSRTEAFGDLVKAAILYGSDTLSEENYDAVYDKALRVRRVVSESFAALFNDYDAVLMPAAPKCAYTAGDIEADRFIGLRDNVCTAPASLAGLPAVAFAGVQVVGPAFSDQSLLDLADLA